jgi:hypothetical protein
MRIRLAKRVVRIEKMKILNKILAPKTSRKKPLGRSRSRWNLRDVGGEVVNWIPLA